jgi:hypothetical protein
MHLKTANDDIQLAHHFNIQRSPGGKGDFLERAELSARIERP